MNYQEVLLQGVSCRVYFGGVFQNLILPIDNVILLNSLFPVVFLILLGVLLKRHGLTDSNFLRTSDKLVYYIFFPLMLFWKIGNSSSGGSIGLNLVLAVLTALAVMFLMSIAVIRAAGVTDFQAGSFAQSCYRFNTYIGVAVILNSLGAEGVKFFGIVIAVAIPVINVAAITTLIWFSGEKMAVAGKWRLVLKSLISNPLIIGCLVGLLYSSSFSGFPQFIDNSLSLVSMVTLPLALISIGGSLTFSGIRQHFFLSFLAALMKLLVFPLTGYCCLALYKVSGIPFDVGMIFFTLPTSTAIYVLSSQMNSDTELASSAILLSTILSFPALSLVLLL